MSNARKKFTIYLHPEEHISDRHTIKVINGTPLSTRGDFFRTSLIAGIALYQLDKRIPTLLATMFEGNLNPDTLVDTVRMTTGWKPSTIEIEKLIELINSDKLSHIDAENTTVEKDDDLSIMRKNLKNIM